MGIEQKTFSDFKDLSLSAYETGLELKKNNFQTAQGLSLDEYNIFTDINDSKHKNYSVNILTDLQKEDDILKPFDKETYLNSFTTKLAFRGTTSLSSSNFLNFTYTSKDNISDIFLGNDSQNTNFTIEFKDGFSCSIKTVMDGQDKFLITDSSNNDNLILSPLNSTIENTSAHIFGYNLDRINNLFTLTKNLTNIVSPLSSGSTLSAFNTNFNNDDRYSAISIIRLTNEEDILKYGSLNNFNLYNLDKDRTISDESLKGDSSNYLSYFLPENIKTGERFFTADLRFFNTKNQISNKYNTNNYLPLKDKTKQRLYTSILNFDKKEKDYETLNLGYNFFTKEYKFISDKYTKFTLPDTLYPFVRMNINDTNLSDNGAYAGSSPYFSDKVFKILDKNKNNIPESQDIIPLTFQQNNFRLLLQEDGFLIFNKNGDEFENNGTFLCSWLSGNNNERGVWYDRYYNPKKTSYLSAITGNKTQIFEYKSLAQRYFEENNIDDIYFDIPSNMIFEPRTTYFYQRIGSNYIDKIIKDSDGKILKDSFNITFTDQGREEIQNDTFDLNLKAFDKVNLFENEKTFSITFDLLQDGLSSLDSYNIIGNYYNEGIELKNNFYVTPFVILQQDNELYFYDSEFNLLQKNTYSDVDTINDVLYLEQTNDVVLICNDRIIKTSFNGEVSDQIINDSLTIELLELYRNRIVDDYSIAYFLKNDIDLGSETINGLYELNLNSLSLSAVNSQILSSGNSIVQTSSGLRPLNGFNGKKINDDVGVSIDGNTIIFQSLTDGTFSNPLSTDKDIYNINTFEDNLYVQAFDSNKNGFIYRFNTERELLSTYNLNVSCVSGFDLEFINDGDGIKLLSLAKDENNFVIADKFNLHNSLSSTYSLNISSVVLSGDNQGNSNFVNPVSFSNIYSKYRDKQGDLYFKVNFDVSDQISVKKDVWSTVFTETLSTWDGNLGTQPVLQQWNTFFTKEVSEVINENFLKINNLQVKNTITLNFNLNVGLIEFYLNGKKEGEIKFKPNKFINDKLLFPDLFFNTPIIFNKPLSQITNNNNFYSNGAQLKNLKIYSDFLSEDFIKFLHLKDEKIDDLFFDIPAGSRSNLEEVDSFYSYSIPGRKNNTLKIYIKNALIEQNSQSKVSDFLSKKLEKVIPANVSKILYNYDINYN